MSATATTPSEAVPLKLKQMQGDANTSSRSTTNEASGKSGPTADKPCKYFISESGCKAGKSCKWLHSWEGVTDKASRCWICGGRDHRKSECKVRSSPKKTSEPSGSGGGGGTGQGRGAGETISTSTSKGSSSSGGGKAGAAAAKVLHGPDQAKPNSSSSTATSVGEINKVNGNSETAAGDGGTGGDQSVTTGKTAELLHEATQLLKTLRVPQPSPILKVMQIGGLDQADANMVLIDSGATHGLRPARDQEEWDRSVRTTVQ